MLLLKDHILKQESKLVSSNGAEKLEVHVALAQAYQYCNPNKVYFHANIVLENTSTENTPILQVKAMVAKVSALLTDGSVQVAMDSIVSLSKKLADTMSEFDSCELKITEAAAWRMLNQLDKAAELLASLKEAVFKYNDPSQLMNYYLTDRGIKKRKGESHGENLYKLLAIAEQQPFGWIKPAILNYLGEWLDENNQTEKALQYFEEAIQLSKQHGALLDLFQAYLFRFNLYATRSQIGTTESDISEAMKIAETIENTRLTLYCKNKRLNVYMFLNKLDLAYKETLELEAHHRQNNQLNDLAFVLKNKGVLLFDLENFQESLSTFLEYEAIQKKHPSLNSSLQLNWDLSNCYNALGDHEKSNIHLRKYIELNKEFSEIERKDAVAEMQTKYESEKREAELRESRLQQTESELKALKAQMNPHFIFNALNSIQEIFFLGDKRLANKHLARFSQLMRSILKASSQKTITLDEEITMLREYLMLEGLRFGEAFSFEISMDDNVDPYTFDVPPMIITALCRKCGEAWLIAQRRQSKNSTTLQF
jgi:tetratricopeptide (TPR) repeat protein